MLLSICNVQREFGRYPPVLCRYIAGEMAIYETDQPFPFARDHAQRAIVSDACKSDNLHQSYMQLDGPSLSIISTCMVR